MIYVFFFCIKLLKVVYFSFYWLYFNCFTVVVVVSYSIESIRLYFYSSGGFMVVFLYKNLLSCLRLKSYILIKYISNLKISF